MVVGQILASGFCLFQNGVLFLCIKKRAFFFLNICSFMAVGKIFASGFTCFKLVLFFYMKYKRNSALFLAEISVLFYVVGFCLLVKLRAGIWFLL